MADWVDVRKGDLVHIHKYEWNGPRGRDHYDVWGIALDDSAISGIGTEEAYAGFEFRWIAGDDLGDHATDDGRYVAVSSEDDWVIPFTAEIPDKVLAVWSALALKGELHE
jgi:hypothetical protein